MNRIYFLFDFQLMSQKQAHNPLMLLFVLNSNSPLVMFHSSLIFTDNWNLLCILYVGKKIDQ